MTAIWSRPRESADLLPIDVLEDNAPVTAFDVAVIRKYGTRPVTGFAPANVVNGQPGVTVAGLEPGDYWAFPRIGGVVLDPIWFRIT